MESLRRAALCLHALAPSDRRWMLRRLSGEHVPTVRAMLSELEAMGIPRDPELLQELDAAGGAERPSLGRMQKRLALARGCDIAELLQDEPVELAAAVLKSDEWAWKADFLEAFDPEERERVRELAGADTGVTPTVHACLSAMLERHLPEAYLDTHECSRQVGHGRKKWWQRLIRGVSWRR